MQNLDLAAEALCAVVGVFPSEITEKDAERARALPREWHAAVREWLGGGDRFSRYRMQATPDPEKTWRRLSEPCDVEALTASFADPELVTAYTMQLEAARRYVLDMWPVLYRETPTGSEWLPPSMSVIGEAYSVLHVLDRPERVLQEMASGTLTDAQAEAFAAVYPGLFSMVQALLREGLGRMGQRKESLPYAREAVLRVLLQMKPGLPIGSPADEMPEQAPQSQLPDINIDFRSYATRSQRIDAR